MGYATDTVGAALTSSIIPLPKLLHQRPCCLAVCFKTVAAIFSAVRTQSQSSKVRYRIEGK